MASVGWDGEMLRRGRRDDIVGRGLLAVGCLPLGVVPQPRVVVDVGPLNFWLNLMMMVRRSHRSEATEARQ